MEKPQLSDPSAYPNDIILKNVLGRSFDAYISLLGRLNENDLQITGEWRYYRDGNAWLFKAVHKKKTILWISAWEGYFKTAFYFTEKNAEGIFSLKADPEIISEFRNAKPIGKLIPLIIDIRNIEQVESVINIARYKRNLKS
jgi:hypothetical protein